MKPLTYSLIVGFLLLPTFAIGQSLPAFPMAFWGSVTINGNLAPVGTVIRAYYGTTLAGTITVQELGVYGYTEATRQKLLVGEGDGTISFRVQSSGFNSGNETAGESSVAHTGFSSGQAVQKNLAFTISTPTLVTSSGGGGGGGGGGGAVSGSVLGVTTTKGDATGDAKVDVLDFNTLLIQWGKSGANLTADLDKNGSVDIMDFNLLLIHWTK